MPLKYPCRHLSLQAHSWSGGTPPSEPHMQAQRQDLAVRVALRSGDMCGLPK